MKVIEKLGIYFLILILAALIGGLYGILHDQISYTLSNEYFTQLKFRQTRIPWAYESPRLGAAYIGFFAAWWMGVLVYSLLGCIGFMFKSPKLMAIHLTKSMLIVVGIAFVTGLVGLIYGYFQVNEITVVDSIQKVPANVNNPIQYLRVAYMHSASYIGGVTSLIAGSMYLIVSLVRYKQSNEIA